MKKISRGLEKRFEGSDRNSDGGVEEGKKREGSNRLELE